MRESGIKPLDFLNQQELDDFNFILRCLSALGIKYTVNQYLKPPSEQHCHTIFQFRFVADQLGTDSEQDVSYYSHNNQSQQQHYLNGNSHSNANDNANENKHSRKGKSLLQELLSDMNMNTGVVIVGGRYDYLTERLFGESVPVVG